MEPIDHTNRLGFAKMPAGYKLLQLDSGHFIYEREHDEAESSIHWNKWAVYRWAVADSKATGAGHGR
jgi:hypothetical protein